MANDRFDKEAAAWDNNPVTVKSSKLAYGSLLEHVAELADEDKAKGMRTCCLCRSCVCLCGLGVVLPVVQDVGDL